MIYIFWAIRQCSVAHYLLTVLHNEPNGTFHVSSFHTRLLPGTALIFCIKDDVLTISSHEKIIAFRSYLHRFLANVP